MRFFVLLSLVALAAATIPAGTTVNKRGQLIARQDVRIAAHD
jgi:adhesin HecA-like repeat protein